MTASSLRKKLQADEIVIGMMVFEFTTPGLPQILAAAGFDFAVFDMESTALELESIRVLIAMSHAAQICPLVRVPHAASDYVARCLELGVGGLIAPKVETAQQAADFVDSAKYPPLGRRGSGYGLFRDSLAGRSAAEAMACANDETVLVCQIETQRGVANAEEITAVSGLDAILVGVNDLSADMGIPGDFANAAFQRAVDAVREACLKHGKVFGGRGPQDNPGADNGNNSARLKPGHRLVIAPTDSALFLRAAREYTTWAGRTLR
jgi:2-keto-3-deoxy-L-rhamnonate aldolase RhmA